MSAATKRTTLNVPIRFTEITFAKCASGCGPSRPIARSAVATPAQLIAPCNAPNASWAVAIAAITCASSVTSVFAKRAHLRRALAQVRPRASLTSHITTFAPAPTNASAQAAPSPELPPVIKNVRSESCMAVYLP